MSASILRSWRHGSRRVAMFQLTNGWVLGKTFCIVGVIVAGQAAVDGLAEQRDQVVADVAAGTAFLEIVGGYAGRDVASFLKEQVCDFLTTGGKNSINPVIYDSVRMRARTLPAAAEGERIGPSPPFLFPAGLDRLLVVVDPSCSGAARTRG